MLLRYWRFADLLLLQRLRCRHYRADADAVATPRLFSVAFAFTFSVFSSSFILLPFSAFFFFSPCLFLPSPPRHGRPATPAIAATPTDYAIFLRRHCRAS